MSANEQDREVRYLSLTVECAHCKGACLHNHLVSLKSKTGHLPFCTLSHCAAYCAQFPLTFTEESLKEVLSALREEQQEARAVREDNDSPQNNMRCAYLAEIAIDLTHALYVSYLRE